MHADSMHAIIRRAEWQLTQNPSCMMVENDETAIGIWNWYPTKDLTDN